MTRWRNAIPSPLFLAAAAGSLAVLWFGGEKTAEPPRPRTRALPLVAGAAEPVAAPATDPIDLDAIAGRPLFSVTRRPVRFEPPASELEEDLVPLAAPEVPEDEAAPSPDQPRVAYLGFIDIGRDRRALLRDQNGEEHWLDLGGEVDGWRLAAIDSARVLFVYNNEEFVIHLYEDNAVDGLPQ